ncbi:MAG: DNA-processing protein DprA [Myxococcota bacterium]
MDTISSFWAGAQDLADKLDLDSLVERAGSWQALMAMRTHDLVAIGVREDLARKWRATRPRETQGLAVTRVHERYPSRLANRPKAPPVLFVEGEREALSERCIGIVGTRRCTPYGAAVARHLGAAFARAGWVVVSGLARGIDTHAHRGALEAGTTVAVLGHGLNMTSPASNLRLRRTILEHHGAMVTTFPDDHQAARWTFPARNRWIVGLSELLVVVEAPQRSGALISAHLALEIDVPVFVVPGHIGVEACRGSNELIEQGACPLIDVDRFVDEWTGRLPFDLPPPSWLQEVLSGHSVDAVATQHGRSALDLISHLTQLELEGRVVRLPGGRYASTGMDLGDDVV